MKPRQTNISRPLTESRIVTADGEANKRALFIVITDYPGGAERVAFGLASELARRGDWKVEVMIVCSALPASFSAHVLPTSVRISYGFSRNWFLSFPLLPFRLLFRRYELVLTTHVYTNALLSALRGLGLISTATLILRESTSIFDRTSGLKRRMFGWLYRLYGREDLVIAQTSYMKDHLRPRLNRRSSTRIAVLPNPVDLRLIERQALAPVDSNLRERLAGRINVVFCGRLMPLKRPGAALEAFRLAAVESRDLQLVFVGDGPLEQDLRREAHRSGLADRVVFLGFRMDPFAIIASCQYGLVTSSREGFPNVLLEMMACGLCKIITTPCAGGLEELDCVERTASFHAREIGEALKQAIQSGADCRDAYRAYVQSRSVAAYVDRMLELAGASSQ